MSRFPPKFATARPKFFNDGFTRATGLLGTTDLAELLGDDLFDISQFSTGNTNGTQTQQNLDGGVVLFATTAAASSVSRLFKANNQVAAQASTSAWYLRARVKPQSAAGANLQQWFVNITGGGNGPAIGYRGGSLGGGSATKFSLWNFASGASVQSSINHDTTNYHLLEMWHTANAGTWAGAVDGESPLSLAVSTDAAAQMFFGIQNFTDAVNYSILFDSVQLITARTP